MVARRSKALRRGAALLLAGMAGMTAAQAETTRFRGMTPYAEARETFRRLGYEPYMMPGADICDSDDPRCYPELESCAKSRTYSCTYTWRRGRAIIEVATTYEHPVVAHAECIVNCASLLKPRSNARGAASPRAAVATRD